MRKLWQACFAVLSIFLAAPALAGPAFTTIGSNASSARPFLGTDYDNLRTHLTTDAEFAHTTFVFLPAIPVISAATLTGTDIFFLTEPGSLTSAEVSALQSFVLGGGDLVLVSDSGADAGISATLTRLDGGSLGSATGTNSGTGGAIVGTGLSTSGPFGTASGTFGVSLHATINEGSASTVIGRSEGAGGTPILIEILPAALGSDSGAVIAMGDVLFMDFFVSPSTLPSGPNNDRLPLNWFAAVSEAPEPSSLLLFAAALMGLGFARRRIIA